jgi:hypothetical protein
MARPQPAPALKRSRPESHAFAPAVETAAPAAIPAAATRNAATAPNRNGGDAASRNAATETQVEPLVKFSIRVAPDKHRHIKATAAIQGMSIQDLATTAISEYLERLGRPLP